MPPLWPGGRILPGFQSHGNFSEFGALTWLFCGGYMGPYQGYLQAILLYFETLDNDKNNVKARTDKSRWSDYPAMYYSSVSTPTKRRPQRVVIQPDARWPWIAFAITEVSVTDQFLAGIWPTKSSLVRIRMSWKEAELSTHKLQS